MENKHNIKIGTSPFDKTGGEMVAISVAYDNKRTIVELPRNVGTDELFSMTLLLLEDLVGAREVLHESIEEYYKTFINIEND